MPYITPKEREPYDAIVEAILLKCTMGIYEELKDERDILIRLLKKQDDVAQDGHFNYLITKIFMRFHWVESNMGYYDTMGNPISKVLEELLFAIMLEVYEPPKYYRYNRAIGMLHCCKKEFRRIWKKEAICVTMFLGDLAKRFYDEVVAPYEDKKRDENEQSHGKDEPILFHADNSLVKILSDWKKYPYEQWIQEQVFGRIQQGLLKIPKKDICGGEFHKVLLAEYGWILQCDICGIQMPLVSHQVFWTNYEHIIHVV